MCLLGAAILSSGCLQLAGDIDEETGEYWFFSVTDPSSNKTTNGTDDYLIRMVIAENQTDDFDFGSLSITLSVNETVYTCGTDSSNDCIYSLSGDDSLWQNEEYINISESGVDICGEDGCGIVVTVVYDGEEIFQSKEPFAVD